MDLRQVQAKRTRLFKRFAARVAAVNLRLRTDNLATMFENLDAVTAEWDHHFDGDQFALLECRRRLAETRLLATLDKKAPHDVVEQAFQAVEYLEYSDVLRKATMSLIYWHYLEKIGKSDHKRKRMEMPRRELTREMSALAERRAYIVDLLKR
jgi:hypothetical protein